MQVRERRCCTRSWPVQSVIALNRGRTYENFSCGCTQTMNDSKTCFPIAGRHSIPSPC